MKVHQILINDSNKLPSSFPDRTQRCLNSVIHYFGNDRHIYCGEELEQILFENFTKEVLLSYRKLNSYSIRSDLARLCLLYLYGGLYSDIHLMFRHTLDENTMNRYDLNAFSPFPDHFRFGYAIQNALLYTPNPGCKILERAIEHIIHHCRIEYYGVILTQIAGMHCLGRSYYDCLSNNENCNLNILGESFNLLSGHRYESLNGFVSDSLGLIAVFEKPVDIRNTGLEGVNYHKKMYYDRNMYDTSIQF